MNRVVDMNQIKQWAKGQNWILSCWDWMRRNLYWKIAPLRYRYVYLRRNNWSTKPRLTIAFLPERPNIDHVLGKICYGHGYKIVDKSHLDADLIVSWAAATHRSSPALFSTSDDLRIINIDCVDISKETLDDVHQQVFGYRVGIDPFTFVGEGVKKSDSTLR